MFNFSRFKVYTTLLIVSLFVFYMKLDSEFWSDEKRVRAVMTPLASDGKPAFKIVGSKPMTKAEYEKWKHRSDYKTRGVKLQSQITNKIKKLKKSSKILMDAQLLKNKTKYMRLLDNSDPIISKQEIEDSLNSILRLPGEPPRDYQKRKQKKIDSFKNREIALKVYFKKYIEYRIRVAPQSARKKRTTMIFNTCKKLYVEACDAMFDNFQCDKRFGCQNLETDFYQVQRLYKEKPPHTYMDEKYKKRIHKKVDLLN